MPGKIKSGEGTLIGNAGEYYVVAELLRQGKIAALAPRNLAFNGKKAARVFFGRELEYGRQATHPRPSGSPSLSLERGLGGEWYSLRPALDLRRGRGFWDEGP